MNNYNSCMALGIFSFLSVTFVSKLVGKGQMFETLGFQITLAVFCCLLIIFGYFIGSRWSTDANKEQAAELNPHADDNLILKNVSILDDVNAVLTVISTTLMTAAVHYYWGS